MKIHLLRPFLFCVLACAFSSQLWAQGNKPAEGPRLQLLRQEVPAPFTPIAAYSNDYYQSPLKEDNPSVDAIFMVNKKTLATELLLLSSDRTERWKKPVRSGSILLSAKANRIAILGKEMHEGIFEPDVTSPNRGIELWDFEGNVLFRNPELPEAAQVFFSPEAELFINAGQKMYCYSPSGTLRWTRPLPVHEIELAGSGDFLKAYHYNSEENNYSYYLLDAATGETVRSWEFNHNTEVEILYASKKQDRLLISVFDGLQSPLSWTMELYRLSNAEKINSLEQLTEAPFYAGTNDAQTWTFMSRRPEIASDPKAGHYSFVAWNSNANTLSSLELGSVKVNIGDNRMRYLPAENLYCLETEQQLYYFSIIR